MEYVRSMKKHSSASLISSKFFKILVSATLVLGLIPLSAFSFKYAGAENTEAVGDEIDVNSLPEGVKFNEASLGTGSVIYVANKPNDAVSSTQFFGRGNPLDRPMARVQRQRLEHMLHTCLTGIASSTS